MNLTTHWISPDRPDYAAAKHQSNVRAGAHAYRMFKAGVPGWAYMEMETEGWREGWKAEEEKSHK